MAKVLLVEDDNNLREIYEARLQAEGYETVTASDGEQALVVAKDAKPDLVISDVMMPKISGFEMLDILRNTDGLKDVKVIMLTALGQSEDKTRADQLGADKYLVKSQVTLEDIVKTAHQLLDDSAAPAPTPAPAADPAPVAAIATDPAPATEPSPIAAAPVVAGADTTEEETKAMQAQIDSFATTPADPAPVATPDPMPAIPADPALVADPAPVAVPEPVAVAPEPTPVAAPEPTPPVPTAAETTAAHDEVMAAAVDSLSTPDVQKPSDVTAVEVAPPVAEPVAAPAPVVTPAAPVAEPETEDDDSDGVTIGHKKIIAPISDSLAKPDINQLLAAEEAATTANDPVPVVPAAATVAPTEEEAAAAAASAAEPVVAPSGIVEPTTGATQPNPNDIAL